MRPACRGRDGVKRKADTKRDAEAPWDEREVRTFLTAVREDRLYAAMMLALIANRPAEVCGARWRDVDLDDKGTITIDPDSLRSGSKKLKRLLG